MSALVESSLVAYQSYERLQRHEVGLGERVRGDYGTGSKSEELQVR